MKISQLIFCLILICTGCNVVPIASPVPTAASTSTPIPPPTPVRHGGSGVMLFSDEFDGTALDKSKWTTCYWWDWAKQGCTIGSNNELEWYQPDDVQVSDGLLRLRAQRRTITNNDGKTYQYTSGMVTSGRSTDDTTAPAGFIFQYGYAEIRAKLPSGQGLWPAFWMLPDNNESKPEIDVLEVLGHAPNTVYMALHYRTEDGGEGQESKTWVDSDFSADWHTFAVDWQPDIMIWYVDGIERWRYTDTARIPNRPMYLLLNLAVGGDWPGAPDSSTTFPSYYEIDYVRVWKHQ